MLIPHIFPAKRTITNFSFLADPQLHLMSLRLLRTSRSCSLSVCLYHAFIDPFPLLQLVNVLFRLGLKKFNYWVTDLPRPSYARACISPVHPYSFDQLRVFCNFFFLLFRVQTSNLCRCTFKMEDEIEYIRVMYVVCDEAVVIAWRVMKVCMSRTKVT